MIKSTNHKSFHYCIFLSVLLHNVLGPNIYLSLLCFHLFCFKSSFLTIQWRAIPIFRPFSPLERCGPTRAMASSFKRFLDHTQRRTTRGRTLLDEWSAHRRDLYLTTHNTHNRQTSMLLRAIRTHSLSRRAAVDPRLRPHGHWDRQNVHVATLNQLQPSYTVKR
jgi:hypothetical protein